ncbi:polysaccharide deacetylase family protein [Streptomyces lycii]|uniref:polysaccharide deacetylase family protein n=1 Tax=Streptomyces lycii TaxID=2654337 RepID=UPI001C3F77E1|nr:polysaccharide deacetylase family protein [Streptomyces lycii]
MRRKGGSEGAVSPHDPHTPASTPASTPTGRRPWRRPVTLSALAVLVAGAVVTGPSAVAGEERQQQQQQDRRAAATIVTSTGKSGSSVAFTFDDGPDPTHTPAMLDVLKKHGVKAVFCLWGDHVRQYPNLVKRIADEGHVLCNHSMSHSDMGGWSAAQVRSDLEATNALIQQAAPGARIAYFRAPYGSWGQAGDVAEQLGMTPLGWRMDIQDWTPPGAGELARRLRDGITPGAVVLMHDGGGDRSQTVQAVDTVIPEFKANGWSFDLPAGG